jgi:hypothetical protein
MSSSRGSGSGHDFLGQADQAVGFARHRRWHHDDPVTGIVPFGDACRDVLDAVRRTHRRTAVFVDY